MFPLSFWRTLRTVPNDPFPITSNGSYSSSMEPILEQSDSSAASLSCDWLHVWRCSLHFPDLRCLYLGEYFEIDRMRQLTVASSAYRYMCLVRWLHIQGLAEYFINDLEVSLDIITWFLLLHIRVGILSRVRFFSQFWKFVWSKARNRVFIQHEQSLSSNKVEVPMLKFQFLRNMKKKTPKTNYNSEVLNCSLYPLQCASAHGNKTVTNSVHVDGGFGLTFFRHFPTSLCIWATSSSEESNIQVHIYRRQLYT